MMQDRVARIMLGFLAFGLVEVGLWALLAPRSFYEDFPGLGLRWVREDGPYNEHLVRDVGELNLALALITIVAMVRLTPVLVRLAATASIVYQVPHVLYHAAASEPDGASRFTELAALVLSILAAALVLGTTLPGRDTAAAPTTDPPPPTTEL